MTHEQRLAERHRHEFDGIVQPSVGHFDAPKHQQRGCQYHQQGLYEEQGKELPAAASVHLHHAELFRAVEVGTDQEMEEVEQTHQQDEQSHGACNPAGDGQLPVLVGKAADGKYLCFIVPVVQPPAVVALHELLFQLTDVGIGCQQGKCVASRHLVASVALQQAFAVVQHQHVHRLHEVEGIVERRVVHDGLHGIGDASVAGSGRRRSGQPAGHDTRLSDGFGLAAEDADSCRTAHHQRVGRMAGRLPASGHDAGREDAGIEAVRLHPLQLVGQGLAGPYLDVEGHLAGIGDKRKGLYPLCPAVHVLAERCGCAGEIMVLFAIIQTNQYNPLVIVETMVGRLYETAAIQADAEAEQAHGQPDDGNDVLCSVFQQVSDGKCKVM